MFPAKLIWMMSRVASVWGCCSRGSSDVLGNVEGLNFWYRGEEKYILTFLQLFVSENQIHHLHVVLICM